jgi:tRNA(Arg) A34 adenosine deaminase TadA
MYPMNKVIIQDKAFMVQAIAEAKLALSSGDVPVGALVVKDGVVIARAHNRREADSDPTAHAEVLAVREAAKAVGSWRLDGCTVYITKEPCVMCAGAMMNARVWRVVYGAPDPRYGAAWSVFNILDDERLNHRCQVISGIMADECLELLSGFFGAKRPSDR